MISKKYWVIFSILTLGMGIVPWLMYLYFLRLGIFPKDLKTPIFSTPFNLGVVILFFRVIVCPLVLGIPLPTL